MKRMGETKIKQERTQVKGPCLFGFPQKVNTWVQVVIWKETPKLTSDEMGKVRQEKDHPTSECINAFRGNVAQPF